MSSELPAVSREPQLSFTDQALTKLADRVLTMQAVGWVSQFASPELTERILYDGYDWADDPRWQESGAPTIEAYRRWAVRWCGMACLRMILLVRRGEAPSLYELAISAQDFGAYSDAPGAPGGLIYHPFVEYLAAEHELGAQVVTDITADELHSRIEDGVMAIASVHPEIRRPDVAAPGRGGHLVLVTGVTADAITFCDPSGHRAEAIHPTLPLAVFDQFFAGRAIIVAAGTSAGGRTPE